MNKLVYSVFKAIAMSIIFIFVWDLVFFMYRVSSLNSRMESISTSMRKVVMENNYLPPEVASNYQKLFQHMICDFNNITYHDNMTEAELVAGSRWESNNVGGGATGSVNSAAFIAGFHWNYGHSASTGLSIYANKSYWTGGGWGNRTANIVKQDMKIPADYGDIMVIQLRVGVFQPIWGWTQADGRYVYNTRTEEERTVNNWVRSAATTELVYTYYVPCLNFRTITSSN